MFKMFFLFANESEVANALQRAQLLQGKNHFRFVRSVRTNGNSNVLEIDMDFFVSWDFSGIAAALNPIEVTVDYHTIWRRPAA